MMQKNTGRKVNLPKRHLISLIALRLQRENLPKSVPTDINCTQREYFAVFLFAIFRKLFIPLPLMSRKIHHDILVN